MGLQALLHPPPSSSWCWGIGVAGPPSPPPPPSGAGGVGLQALLHPPTHLVLVALHPAAAAPAAAGTLTHMAPELLLSGQLRPAGDVYSFGIIRKCPPPSPHLHQPVAHPTPLASPRGPPNPTCISPGPPLPLPALPHCPPLLHLHQPVTPFLHLHPSSTCISTWLPLLHLHQHVALPSPPESEAGPPSSTCISLWPTSTCISSFFIALGN